jgi:hypothetical protein
MPLARRRSGPDQRIADRCSARWLDRVRPHRVRWVLARWGLGGWALAHPGSAGLGRRLLAGSALASPECSDSVRCQPADSVPAPVSLSWRGSAGLAAAARAARLLEEPGASSTAHSAGRAQAPPGRSCRLCAAPALPAGLGRAGWLRGLARSALACADQAPRALRTLRAAPAGPSLSAAAAGPGSNRLGWPDPACARREAPFVHQKPARAPLRPWYWRQPARHRSSVASCLTLRGPEPRRPEPTRAQPARAELRPPLVQLRLRPLPWPAPRRPTWTWPGLWPQKSQSPEVPRRPQPAARLQAARLPAVLRADRLLRCRRHRRRPRAFRLAASAALPHRLPTTHSSRNCPFQNLECSPSPPRRPHNRKFYNPSFRWEWKCVACSPGHRCRQRPRAVCSRDVDARTDNTEMAAE